MHLRNLYPQLPILKTLWGKKFNTSNALISRPNIIAPNPNPNDNNSTWNKNRLTCN